MSNDRIRILLNETLLEGLRQPDENLKYPVFINGIQDMSLDETYIQADLIPSPVINGTLGGDHKGFIGIYQMTIKASNGMELTDPTVDLNDVIAAVVADLQEVFPINSRIGDENEFVVQVLTSISVSQTTRERTGSKWEAHAYFTYRADTN